MNRLSIEISAEESKLKDKAKSKAILEQTTLRAILVKALEAYVNG